MLNGRMLLAVTNTFVPIPPSSTVVQDVNVTEEKASDGVPLKLIESPPPFTALHDSNETVFRVRLAPSSTISDTAPPFPEREGQSANVD